MFYALCLYSGGAPFSNGVCYGKKSRRIVSGAGGGTMDFIIAGLTAAALAVYLVYALLHPDKF